jgi:hypothetical protein
VLDVSNPTDGVREDRQPLFRAQFAIPEPRPNGTMWVVVTAYDASGVPLGGERRPFRVGPIVDVETGPYVVVDAPPLDQKRCGPAVSGWRCG